MTESTDKKWLRVSYSSLNTFTYCNRKFEFAKLYGQTKERINDDSIPAKVGQAFHLGYQKFIATRDMDRAIFTFLSAYPWELALVADRNTRAWDVCLSTFVDACQRFTYSDYELMMIKHPDPNKGEVPCVEVPFELRFLNTQLPGYEGIAFIGFIDIIMRSRMTQSIRTFDIKTHRDNFEVLATALAPFTEKETK